MPFIANYNCTYTPRQAYHDGLSMTSPTPWSTAVRFNLLFPDRSIVRNLTKKQVLSRLENRLRINRITPDDIWYTILVQGFDQQGNSLPQQPIRISDSPLFAQQLQNAPWFQPYWQTYQPIGNPPPPPEPRFFVRGQADMTIFDIVEALLRCPEQKMFVRLEATHDWKEATTIPDIINLLNHQRDLSRDR